jgi:hypothetical protein
MNSIEEKSGLLRELGWSEELISAFELHEKSADFGISAENKLIVEVIDQVELWADTGHAFYTANPIVRV